MQANEFDKMFLGPPTADLFSRLSHGLPTANPFSRPSHGLPTANPFSGPSPGLPTANLFSGPSPGLPLGQAKKLLGMVDLTSLDSSPMADLRLSLQLPFTFPLGQTMPGNKNDTKLANTEECDHFYHYTNKEGADAIQKSKKIKASRKENGDAVFGDGVYGTMMPPDKHSKKDIRRNNYDTSPSFYNQSRFKDKADYAIKVNLPKNKARKVKETKRNVYVVDDEDLDLNDYDFEVIENK